jgi:hypothetical protein
VSNPDVAAISELANLTSAQLAQLDVGMQRSSCLYFATRNLKGAPEAPYNGRFIAGDHHFEWDNLVSGKQARGVQGIRACILAPRDHGKSFFFNLAYPIWRGMFGKPGEVGYIFSANQQLAIEFLEKIVEEITSNPKLQHLAPRNWEQVWSKRRIKLTTGVEIRTRGFGVKVRGGHPHWIICDDVLGDENITSEITRKRCIDFFFSAITNMVIPGGELLVVGTPMHQADLYAKLRENGVYRMWRKAALQKGKPLWPTRYSLVLLKAKKEDIGSVRFTREFLVQPFSDEMSMFPSYLFVGEVLLPTVTLGMGGAYWDSIGITNRVMGVDIAMSAETGADFLVIFVMARDANGNRWICEILREKGMSFQAQLDLIDSTSKLYQCSLVFIEANQMQRVWSDELIRTSDMPVKKFFTTGSGKGRTTNVSQSANKHSLEAGVPILRPLFENKKWRIPRGNDQRTIENVNAWSGEMQAMSFIDGKVQSVGEHDDCVMACWIAEQALRAGGFSASFGAENLTATNKVPNMPTAEPGMDPRKEDTDVPQPDPTKPKTLPPKLVTGQTEAELGLPETAGRDGANNRLSESFGGTSDDFVDPAIAQMWGTIPGGG